MRPPVLSAPLSALLYILALSTCILPLAHAARTLQNVTVDDTDGSPTGGFQIVYEPPGVWSTGQNCTTCEAKVDRTQALNGTWHDVSFISDNPPPAPISATLTFDGVAVYAFCIVTRSFSDPNGNWDLSFLIDGEPAGAFTLAPDGDAEYTYNYPVYANTSLAPGTHTFTMVVGHKGGKSSLALLDYMMFTQEVGSGSDPGSSSSSTGTSSTPAASSPIPSSSDSAAPAGAASSHSSSSTTTIALAVSLSVATLLALSALILLLARCRAHRLPTSHADPSNSALGDPTSKVDPSEGQIGLGGSTLSSGFRVFPIFPRHGRAHAHDSRVAHPFVVPPARVEPPPPPAAAVSPSDATSYTWLPEAGAYVAVKGGDAGVGGASVSSASGYGAGAGSGSGSGTAVSGRERLDAELPPIPQSPQDARGASRVSRVSSHEPSATATATAIERYAAPVGRSVQRYVQNDDGASAAGGGGGAVSPVSLGSTGMEDAKVRLEGAASERASPVSAVGVDTQVEVGTGAGAGQAVGSEFGVGAEAEGMEAEAEDEGPPPYAPRVP